MALEQSSADQDRQAAVAGLFYPADERQLKQTLIDLFARAIDTQGWPEIAALMVPHAGYVYSGAVAASGFAQLNPQANYDTIFILGPSHRVGFSGAAVYCQGDFITPLGRVAVNRQLGRELIAQSPWFSERSDAHAEEHCIEVQLPLLQHHLKHPFRLVPIVLGDNSPEICQAIGLALKPYLKANNLFVISTDFSHYPGYQSACQVDRAVAQAISSNDTKTLIDTIRSWQASAIPNLATTLCGVSGVLSLLAMTAGDPRFHYHLLHYQNSGDTPGGDRRRVVGYQAMAITRQGDGHGDDPPFVLRPEDKATLLAIARQAVTSAANGHLPPPYEPSALSTRLTEFGGAFVTLKRHGQLRGCIGQFGATIPLCSLVQEMAVAAASQDPRFRPLEVSELAATTVEISVLTPLRRIKGIDQFELGRHGITLRLGRRSGTFLPQVALETGWTKEEFLGHCAQDKAGIGWEGWREAEIYVYEAVVFGEE